MTVFARKQQRNQRWPKAAAWLLISCVATPPAFARDYNYNKEMTQQDAMGYGSNNYWNGSGDSKDEGVRNGMRAMGRLAALDIGGAIHYGYKGYGNYINSQKMDDLDNRAWKKKDTMLSINNNMIGGAKNTGGGDGAGIPSDIGPEKENAKLASGANGKSKNGSSEVTSKKWRDMDKGFLYRGETADVAAEFEKKTGMSREEFFDQVANAADSNLSFDDPNLMNNLEQRFEAFKAGVRNKDFKDKLDKVHAMFSFAKKTDMLQEAAAFYYKERGPIDPAGAPQVAGDVNGSASNISAAGNGSPGKLGEGDRGPASDAAPKIALQSNSDPREAKLTKEQMGALMGLEKSYGDELKDIMVNSEDTIFKVVTKKYRKLTPGLLGQML